MTHRTAGRWRRVLLGQTLGLLAGAFTVGACGDDGGGNNNTLQCGPNTGNSTISGSLSVAYSASLAGSGTVNTITYTTDAGDQTVTNPTLPWQASVTLATLPAAIRATGSVTTGTITIGYNAVGAPDRAEQDTATCTQTNQ